MVAPPVATLAPYREHPDRAADVDPSPHRHGGPHGQANAHRDAPNRHGNGNPRRHGHAHRNPHGNGNPDRRLHADSTPHRHPSSNPHPHANLHRNPDVHADDLHPCHGRLHRTRDLTRAAPHAAISPPMASS